MSQKRPEAATVTDEDPGRILVEDATGRRPFMRGILIHSLMARGVDYEEAYRVANAVRERIRPKRIVRREEIASLAAEVRGPRAVALGPLPLAADILVTGQGEGTRFSKGFLSQSLLAAAVDPNDAFDVAREIEGELVQRRSREI